MLNQDKHRQTMFQILQTLFNSEAKDSLAFKWWTLCYFLYHLPRFSTDLDFDLIKPFPNIMEYIENLLQSLDVDIKDIKDKKFTYFFLVSYWSGEHSIKIEISKKIYQATEYEQINFFWKPIFSMSKWSLFANKLVAMSERFTNRDIFDVYYFFTQGFPINEWIISERTKLSPIDFYSNLEAVLDKHYKPNTILAEIWDLITEKQKHFMKTKIVSEVQGYLQFKIFEWKNPM